MIISRLKDGFTLEQAKARADSAEPKGPSPWENYGGVADLTPGDTTVMTATFTPGTYRMFCLTSRRARREPCGEGDGADFHGRRVAGRQRVRKSPKGLRWRPTGAV